MQSEICILKTGTNLNILTDIQTFMANNDKKTDFALLPYLIFPIGEIQ